MQTVNPREKKGPFSMHELALESEEKFLSGSIRKKIDLSTLSKVLVAKSRVDI